MVMVCVCYLIGSIPSAYLLGKVVYHLDIRQHGSGNIGTMNTRLVMGWLPAMVVLLVDGGKGVLAVYAAVWFGLDQTLALLLAVIGHIWPVWLRFEGGKGLATTLGGLIALGLPWMIVSFISVWLLVFMLRRSADMAAMWGSLGMAACAVGSGPFPWLIMLGMAIMTKHAIVLRAAS